MSGNERSTVRCHLQRLNRKRRWSENERITVKDTDNSNKRVMNRVSGLTSSFEGIYELFNMNHYGNRKTFI